MTGARRSSDDLVLAIAHPARRTILEACVLEDEVSVGRLQALTKLSPSALSQHLRVLKDAGLVAARRDGRRMHYRITPEPLFEVMRFVERLEAKWNERLDALGRYLDEQPAEPGEELTGDPSTRRPA